MQRSERVIWTVLLGLLVVALLVLLYAVWAWLENNPTYLAAGLQAMPLQRVPPPAR